MYDDPSDKMVEFKPVHIWQIGEENTIEYMLPHGFDEASSDWIGIYKVMNISMKSDVFDGNAHKF